MARRVWHCQKCNLQFVRNGSAPSGGCSAGGSHKWNVLGDAGCDNTWQCQKCGIVVSLKGSSIKTNGCSEGGSHKWYKLT